MIKLLSQALLIIILIGCSNTSNNRMVFDTLRGVTIGFSNEDVTKQKYESYKYSFLKLRIGNLKPVYLVLSSIENNIFKWVSADNIHIYTFNGKIVKSQGMINDLNIVGYEDFIFCDNCEHSFYIDYTNPKLVSAKTMSRMYKFDQSYLKYLMNDIEVTTYKEISNNPGINFRSINKYSVLNNGRVIKSEQKISPLLDKITLEFFYK